MKRYLYILLTAVVALFATSCELLFPQPVATFTYDGVSVVNIGESNAEIKVYDPRVELDGVHVDGVTVWLSYEGVDRLEATSIEDGVAYFVLANLTPSTEYAVYLNFDAGEHGTKSIEITKFTTKDHVPVCTMECDCTVEPYGLYANVEFAGVAYLVDGEPSDISRLRLEYARANSEEWVGCDFISEVIINGVFEQRVPFEDDILEENRNYKLRLTLYPKSDDYEPISSEVYSFKTVEAVWSAEFYDLMVEADGDNLRLECDMPDFFVDGMVVPDYADLKYQFYYSDEKGEGDAIDAECADGKMRAEVPLVRFKSGATYSFCCRLDINDANVMDSDDVEFTIPQAQIPAPPTPPITGNADTSDIAGDWHLTQWRGSEPSFDVYLSITDNGVVSLFQRLTTHEWQTFFSAVGYDNGVISGEYTDGVKWGSSYYVEVNGDSMTWTSTTDNSDISVYTRCTLPDVTNKATRASVGSYERFL